MTTMDCVNMYKIMHLYHPETLTSSSSLQKENKNKNKKNKQTQTQKNQTQKTHGMPRGSKTKKKQCKLYVIVKQLSI